jgi:hypothetical protein
MTGESVPAAEVLRQFGNGILLPPFEVVECQMQPQGRYQGDRPDAIVALRWGGQDQRFAVEYTTSSTPREINRAAEKASRYARADRSLAPMVAAPYLKPEVLDTLVDTLVSGVDLSGNYAIVVPDRWLVVRQGAANRFPASTPIKNIYRGRSGLIPRALLLRGPFFRSATALAADLETEQQVSLPTVSKVLTALEKELLIERTSEGIRVTQPALLLDRLAAEYKPPQIRRRLVGQLSLTKNEARRLDENAASEGIRYAFDGRGYYVAIPTANPLTRVYTQSIDPIVAGLPLDVTSRFPTFEFLEVDDPGVYYGVRPDRILPIFVTSPLQVYLELSVGDRRELQSARDLRDKLVSGQFRLSQ